MKRKTAILLLAVIALMALLGGIFFVVNENQTLHSERSEHIVTTDSHTETASFEMPIKLKSNGKYVITVNFWPESNPGFLTGFSVISGKNETVFSSTAQKLLFESNPMRLSKGDNVIRFSILANNDDYRDFVKANHIEENNGTIFEPWDGFCDSDVVMKYDIIVKRSYSDIALGAGIALIIFGLALGIMLSLLFRKGEKVKGEYDERMQLARNKCASDAFFVTIIGLTCAYALTAVKADLPVDISVIIMFILLLGLTTWIVKSILNDGYFALNDNRKRFLTAFIIMAVVMLALSIFNIVNGFVYVGGTVTVQVTPILLFLMLVAIITASAIRIKREKAEDDE